MPCPYLEEVVMAFCRGYPVKKMIPVSRLTNSGRCFGEEFGSCPLFKEIMERIRALSGEDLTGAVPDAAERKGVQP